MSHLSHLKNSLTPPPFRRKIIKLLALLSATSIALVGAYTFTQHEEELPAAVAAPTAIVNGTFDYPSKSTIASCLNRDISSFFSWYMTPDGKVSGVSIPGWNASAYGWKSTQTTPYPVGGTEIQCWGGTNQWGELCAQQDGAAIYQDISTIKGAVYKWTLKHTSRFKEHDDEMQVMIGSTTSQAVQPAWRIENGKYTAMPEGKIKTHNPYCDMTNGATSPTGVANLDKAWRTYTGAYLVKDTLTRFTFKSVSSYGPAWGNLVDDISFQITFPIRYDANGGDGSKLPDPAATNLYPGYYPVGAAVNMTNVVPTRTGYTFIGWAETALAPAVNKATYDANKAKLVSSVKMTTNGKTVYAVWVKNPTITYTDPLDNNKVVYSQTVPFGSPASGLPEGIFPPTHEHYDFIGYATTLPSATYEDTVIPLAYKGSAVKLRVQLINAKNNSPLRWAGFNITASSKSDKNTLSLITGNAGCAVFDGIYYGDYTATLIDRPEGFLYPDYIADFSADPALADKDGYITVNIPVMPQLSRRMTKYESNNVFHFGYSV